ncbi:MAG: hypothetical protein AAFW73_22745 [Bacteroidota bacterium]
MTLKFNPRYVQALVLVVCMSLASCNQDVRPRQLDGTWELKSVNKVPADPGTTWEFEKDGGFKNCQDGDCFEGSWEWEERGEELEIEYIDNFGDNYRFSFEVDMLDKEVFEGEVVIDGDLYLVAFERD